ncbi:DUF6797 domain-containing protein [Blastopirellula marina]|uniref:Heme-binding domain-containing protein n=1 Tax=Blastopirellula marina TaxID=124 RepID=A0A2S8FNL0_9BACT|nr:DUF6797 domain-containing protein [Blastopirellula marina]PQO33782.1 heme-binding domain-containing protein [Blastopirellula marina]PTL43569.1 heme-binding domain-containing protein [Blastopirellula marina]
MPRPPRPYRLPIFASLVPLSVAFALLMTSDQHQGIAVEPDEFCRPDDLAAAMFKIPDEYDAKFAALLAKSAGENGDVDRGMSVFRSAKFACLSCHQIGTQGGTIGPELSDLGKRLTPEQIVEAVLWPKHTVKPEYSVWLFQLADGQSLKGYKRNETKQSVEIFDPATRKVTSVAQEDIEASRDTGTLMPLGLANGMSISQRRDLVRFLLELGHRQDLAVRVHQPETPAEFDYDRGPLDPNQWQLSKQPVNRDRLYDFYRKEAMFFGSQTHPPHLLPAFPGLDGGTQGHWGNQNEETWKDGRWSEVDKGPVLAGVTHLPGKAITKGICVQLGDQGEMSTCFNPETLSYEAIWQGGFVNFSNIRHGFMDGLRPVGKMLPPPQGPKPSQPFQYLGYYRVGKRIVFSYRIGHTEYLDAPWVNGGKFERVVAEADKHPLFANIKNPPAQWPQVINTIGSLGSDDLPYTVDTIKLPFENPSNSLLFIGDHDFLSDGTAIVATMTGDVWMVSGLDDTLANVEWKQFATGLHQPLGVAVHEDQIYVLGRDQITRLVDLNGDQEADFYQCFSNVFDTSPGGHDFTCGLVRDDQGRFYTASGKDGLLRISADGQKSELVATGFRNPDGIGLTPDGKLTVPCSEGGWTPASMVCLVDPTTNKPAHFGYRGPQNGQAPSLPLVYLPRGLDNSSGGQVVVQDERFGPLNGQLLHTSFGMGTHFLVLRDEVNGQPQGAVVPLAGEFRSGIHRAKINPHDGQLYVSGMTGWGSYTPDDGCFQRVRYTGKPTQMPIDFHLHENGIVLTFAEPIDANEIRNASANFAQAWNYRYSSGYGSPELAPSHPGVVGHETVEIGYVYPLDAKSLFVEIPELQPVNQLHLLLKVDSGPPQELFFTVHQLDKPFTNYPGYRPTEKVIAAHPLAQDMALLGNRKPNPWQVKPKAEAQAALKLSAGPNLTYSTKTLHVQAGQMVQLTFANPDVVPHNWVLLKPGTLATVGDLANKLVADPAAALNQYVPKTDDVLSYTDIVQPQKEFTIYFQAPDQPGRYPYLCSFPGHWMVMNGELIVE